MCAIKFIKKDLLLKSESRMSNMLNELKVLETVSHPNIVSVKELFYNEKYFILVMELAEYGELFSHI